MITGRCLVDQSRAAWAVDAGDGTRRAEEVQDAGHFEGQATVRQVRRQDKHLTGRHLDLAVVGRTRRAQAEDTSAREQDDELLVLVMVAGEREALLEHDVGDHHLLANDAPTGDERHRAINGEVGEGEELVGYVHRSSSCDHPSVDEARGVSVAREDLSVAFGYRINDFES